jgi:CRISPR-associated protein Cmr6
MFAVTKLVGTALTHGCDAWHLQLDKLSFKRDGDATSKTDALRMVRDCYTRDSANQLAGACRSRQRLLDVLKRQHSSRFTTVELVLDSKLLLHLGRANVLENVGIYADRTTGLPMVPGTALKGVLSMWACWEANQLPDGSFNKGQDFIRQRQLCEGGLAQRIFGDDSEEGSEYAGNIIFVGGFPVLPPPLGLDIVNPHHEPNGKEKLNLTPNAFLCVEPGTKWRFAFFVRPGTDDAATLLETTTAWLTQALTQLGLGAKTAAGYGRFRTMSQSDVASQAKEAEKTKATETAAIEQAKQTAEKAKQHAAAQAAMKIDYPNEITYRNTVLRLANNPGQWTALQREIEKLKKPENTAWLAKFKRDTSDRAYRKLREQPWYPK